MYINYDEANPTGICNSMGGGIYDITNNIIIKGPEHLAYRGIDIISQIKK